MGQVIEIESNIELFAFLNSNNVTNVILGNGFSLSHPVLKDSFKFDFETVKDYIESSLKDVPKGIQNCPEKVLGYTCHAPR